MKYKLLKDTPHVASGAIIEIYNGEIKISNDPYAKYHSGKYVCETYDYVQWLLKNHPEDFEPIVEKKKFEDLKEGDYVWIIHIDGRVESICFMKHLAKHETFLTEHDAEMERLRRQARANVYLPENGEKYWTWSFYDEDSCEKCGISSPGNNYYYFIGNVHKTKEAAEEYGRKYAKAFEIPNE